MPGCAKPADWAPCDERPVRAMVEETLRRLDDTFKEIYGEVGRPSIVPERLLRALLLMLLYTIRSQRILARAVALQPAVPYSSGWCGPE